MSKSSLYLLMLVCLLLLVSCAYHEDVNSDSYVRFDIDGQEFELDSVRATTSNWSLFVKRRTLYITGKAGNNTVSLRFRDKNPIEDTRCIGEGKYNPDFTFTDLATLDYYYTYQGRGEITDCVYSDNFRSISGTFSGTLMDSLQNEITFTNGEIKNLHFR